MRKHSLLPILALLGGVLGSVFRQKQLETGMEAETGLPIPGNIYSILLILLTLILAAMLMVFLRKLRLSQFRGGLELGLPTVVYPVVTSLGSLALFASGVIGLVGYFVTSPGEDMLKNLFLSAFALVCALATGIFSLGVYRQRSLRRHGVAAIIPVFFTCLWLIVDYRDQSSNPVILSYVYETFALICGILGFYYASGFVFNRYSPSKAVFFQLMCVYFLIVCVAETVGLMSLLSYIFLGIYMIVYAVSILRSANF